MHPPPGGVGTKWRRGRLGHGLVGGGHPKGGGRAATEFLDIARALGDSHGVQLRSEALRQRLGGRDCGSGEVDPSSGTRTWR
jgi:hypothetical protein